MQLPLKLFHNCRLRPSIGQPSREKAHLHHLMPCHVALARGEREKHVQRKGKARKGRHNDTRGWMGGLGGQQRTGTPLGDEFPFLSRTRSQCGCYLPSGKGEYVHFSSHAGVKSVVAINFLGVTPDPLIYDPFVSCAFTYLQARCLRASLTCMHAYKKEHTDIMPAEQAQVRPWPVLFSWALARDRI